MMQKKQTLADKLSSVVFFWIAFGVACLAILGMFLPALDLSHVYFGQRGIVNSTVLFFIQGPDRVDGAGAFIFVGYMLAVVGAIITMILALPITRASIKTEKTWIIVSCICFIVGGLLILFTKPIFFGWCGIPLNQLSSYAGPYIAGTLALIAAALDIIGLKLDL